MNSCGQLIGKVGSASVVPHVASHLDNQAVLSNEKRPVTSLSILGLGGLLEVLEMGAE